MYLNYCTASKCVVIFQTRVLSAKFIKLILVFLTLSRVYLKSNNYMFFKHVFEDYLLGIIICKCGAYFVYDFVCMPV